MYQVGTDQTSIELFQARGSNNGKYSVIISLEIEYNLQYIPYSHIKNLNRKRLEPFHP